MLLNYLIIRQKSKRFTPFDPILYNIYSLDWLSFLANLHKIILKVAKTNLCLYEWRDEIKMLNKLSFRGTSVLLVTASEWLKSSVWMTSLIFLFYTPAQQRFWGWSKICLEKSACKECSMQQYIMLKLKLTYSVLARLKGKSSQLSLMDLGRLLAQPFLLTKSTLKGLTGLLLSFFMGFWPNTWISKCRGLI